jgi:hypothetical protein
MRTIEAAFVFQGEEGSRDNLILEGLTLGSIRSLFKVGVVLFQCDLTALQCGGDQTSFRSLLALYDLSNVTISSSLAIFWTTLVLVY